MSIIDLYDLFIHNPQITTDSRNCPKGSIFFALKGDKFDGNQYAGKALALSLIHILYEYGPEKDGCLDRDPARYGLDYL